MQSFARGLEVIRSFSSAGPQQTLSEVAAHTGLSRAGARCILLTLQTLGYVEFYGRLFRLTPRILGLDFADLSSLPIWILAEPTMEALADRVHESCSVAVLNGLDVVYVLRMHTHKNMSTNLGVGSRLPALWTSMGRVLMATLPEDELRRRLAQTAPLQRFTPHTLLDDDGLCVCVRQTREQGWCLVNQELEEGLISVAAPLKNRAGQTVVALIISGQANHTSAQVMPEQFLPALLQSTQAILRLLGARV